MRFNAAPVCLIWLRRSITSIWSPCSPSSPRDPTRPLAGVVAPFLVFRWSGLSSSPVIRDLALLSTWCTPVCWLVKTLFVSTADSMARYLTERLLRPHSGGWTDIVTRWTRCLARSLNYCGIGPGVLRSSRSLIRKAKVAIPAIIVLNGNGKGILSGAMRGTFRMRNRLNVGS